MSANKKTSSTISFGYVKLKTKRSAENPGGSAETVKILKLNSSCQAEEKITVQKKTKTTS